MAELHAGIKQAPLTEAEIIELISDLDEEKAIDISIFIRYQGKPYTVTISRDWQ